MSIQGKLKDQTEFNSIEDITKATPNKFVSLKDTRKDFVHVDGDLVKLSSLLVPGGDIELHEPVSSQDLESRLLLAGFDEIKVEVRDGCVVASAKKPEWEGEAQNISLKPKNAWKLGGDDLVEDDFQDKNSAWSVADVDGELEDENQLLDIVNIQTVNPGDLKMDTKGSEECGPSKKPCKNCVCGRADAEASGTMENKKKTFLESGAATEESGKLVIDTVKLKGAGGGCGSCSLGDAFRCKGCPSAGLPSYTVGEKIVLDLAEDEF